MILEQIQKGGDILNIYTEIGNRIRDVRLQSGITQEKLSELSGISSNFISQIERGKNKCSLETIHKLSEALSTPLPSLFSFKTSQTASEKSYIKRIEILLKDLNIKDKNLVLEITSDIYGKIKKNNR